MAFHSFLPAAPTRSQLPAGKADCSKAPARRAARSPPQPHLSSGADRNALVPMKRARNGATADPDAASSLPERSREQIRTLMRALCDTPLYRSSRKLNGQRGRYCASNPSPGPSPIPSPSPSPGLKPQPLAPTPTRRHAAGQDAHGRSDAGRLRGRARAVGLRERGRLEAGVQRLRDLRLAVGAHAAPHERRAQPDGCATPSSPGQG